MDRFTKRLRLHVLAGFVSLFASFVQAVELAPVAVQDFSPGLATKQDPSDICDGCAQDLQNVDVYTGAVVKRRGSVKQNSAVLGAYTSKPTRFGHEFIDSSNNSWLLTVSSNTLFKSNDGGVTNSVVTSTHGITSLSRFCGVNAFGYARLTDGTTNWLKYDGSNLSVSTASPKGLTCEFFGERVLTSVGSTLYASRFGDAEDWTADAGTDNDAFSTQVRQSDGYNIRAIKRFKYGVLVLKDYSTDLFTLSSDGLTFVQTSVSNTIGTQYPESVVERENDIIWLGHDGYYSFNGSQLRKLSEPISETIKSIKQLNSFTRSYSESTQADFNNGVFNNTTSGITSGSVQLSTYSATDDTTTEFETFTSTLNVTIANNRITLTANNEALLESGFENTGTWTYGPNATRSTTRSRSGAYSARLLPASGAPLTYSVTIYDPSDNVINTVNLSGCSGNPVTFDDDIYVTNASITPGRYAKIKIALDSTAYIISPVFLAGNSGVRGYVACTKDPGTGGYTTLYLDDFEWGRSTIYSGTFTSKTFDTSLSSPVWSPSSVNWVTYGHSIGVQTQSSDDGITWDSAVAWSTGSAPSSAWKRYGRYVVTLSTGGTQNGTALPYVDSVTLNARSLNGRYTSTTINTNSASTWNIFTAGSDVSSGGSVVYEIYSDTDTVFTATNTATFISSQTITNSETPTITISTYARVGAYISISSPTHDPSFTDFTLTWNEGSSIFPVSSLYYNGDYYSAVALNRYDRNDTILIYDRNGAWTLYTYPAYCLFKYLQRPYFGSSIQGDIARFQVDDIYQDYDGSAIDAYWISKEFDFGYPLTPKSMNRYYVTGKYRSNDTATFEWGVDRGSLTSESPMGTLDLDLYPGFFRKSIVPSSLTYKRGLSHRFKISNNVLGDRFDILSVILKADLETSP